jgi:tetratricopeptide (TPR) repeat protein
MKDLQLGTTLEQKGNLEEAVFAYRRAVKNEPKSAQAHHFLAKALTKKGYWQEAINHYHKTIELEPKFFNSCQEMGRYLAKLNHRDKAINLYQKIGDTLAKKNLFQEAITVYEQAIELNLDQKWFYLYIGDIYNRQGNSAAAIDAYLKAIELAPEFWQPHDRLLIKVQRDRLETELLERMIEPYQEVIRKRPDYLLGYSNLGDILTKLGRLDEAISCYQNASYRQNLKLKPKFIEQAWDAGKRGQTPKFVIIGSMRCGTTSLYEYLTFHPQFVPAIKKEVKFFNFNFGAGKEWYLAHFPAIAEGKNYVTGEGSPDHLYYPEVAPRILELFPDMKLIVMLRNPIDRSISQYYHWRKVGAEFRSLQDAIADEIDLIKEMAQPYFDGKIARKGGSGCLLESVYIYFLEKWMSIIPKEQFLILKSEDFYQNTPATLDQVFKFVGLPNYQLTDYKTYNAGSYSNIKPEMRQLLVECFRPHNQRLEEFLGMKFDWDR